MSEAYRKLWIAVLKQAIKDIGKCRSWFEDGNKETGSFQWICSVLDLHPGTIKSLLILNERRNFNFDE